MPSSDDVKQITLQPGQFAWCRDEKSGQLRLYVGPTRLTPTDDDTFLKQDPNDPGHLIAVSSIVEAVQDFVTVKSGEYAVVHNPVRQADDEYPNGKYSSDKNGVIELEHGKTRVLTGGYFPVWPGQRVEVRPVHELESNEYLIVRVVDAARVDKDAPFYALTEECAGITAAVVDTTETSAAAQAAASQQASEGEGSGKPAATEGSESSSPATTPAASAKAPIERVSVQTAELPKPKLNTGQQIVIPGSKTPTYVPPTGIEIVPDSSVDESGRAVTPNFARALLETFERRRTESESETTRGGQPPMRGGPSHLPTELDAETIRRRLTTSIQRGEMNRRSLAASVPVEDYQEIDREVGNLMRAGHEERAAMMLAVKSAPSGALVRLAQAVRFDEPAIDLHSRTVGGTKVEALQVIAGTPRLVRQAVVLGPTEFCVLLDADGRPQIHKGPGRVFPGPYDRFQTIGSKNRVYNAYHLRTDRALLLRIIAEKIQREVLKQELPEGTPPDILAKEVYLKGDEVFIGGFDAYLVPSNSFEVINPGLRIEPANPTTRSPHIGNDHSDVYVQAIGVDQKSGVYVMNVETGQVQLVRGEKKLLLDPRKQRHVRRRVPGKAWNLIIGRAETHKKVDDDAIVETPWALSVIVPNNEAILVTSKDGRRVVVGPCTELLGFEEWLEKLTLSRGRPKSEVDKLETCFLRVSGNRVTDRISLQTGDFVTIQVDVSYGVTFEDQSKEAQFQWFDHRNYVQLLYTHLRSLLQAAARKRSLMDLYPVLPDFIRDTVLGVKEEGEQHRPGRKLPNNMLVDEVEVLDITIPDTNVAGSMQQAQRTAVVRQIQDRSLQSELESARLRDEIEQQQHELKLAAVERSEEYRIRETEADHKVDAREAYLDHEQEEAREENRLAILELSHNAEGERRKISAGIDRELKEAASRVELDIQERQNKVTEALKRVLAELETGLIDTNAKAAELQLKAIQPGLVEAIEGLGDKELLTILSQNLPAAGGTLGFLLGTGGMAALKKMVEGTALAKTLDKLGLNNGHPETPVSTEPTKAGTEVATS